MSTQRPRRYHPNRECTPCLLCGKSEAYLTHFAAWSASEKAFLTRHYEKEVQPDSCICRADHLEVMRHLSDYNYIPKWKKARQSDKLVVRQCIHPDCEVTSLEEKLIKPSFQPLHRLKAAIRIPPTCDQPFVVCQRHYHQIYKIFTAPLPCACCGAKPKYPTQYNRHSPDAHTICQHLRETTGFGGSIEPDDHICYTCYKLHLVILQQLETKFTSSDSALKGNMEIWVAKVGDGDTDELTRAVLNTVLFVADEILHERAILLPKAWQVFMKAYLSASTTTTQLQLEIGDSTITITSQWLLHQLILYLEAHLSYRCIHRKFGTILYRTGGNLLTSLSWALGSPKAQATEQFGYNDGGLDINKANIMHEAGYIMNDLLHNEIRRLATEGNEPREFDLDSFVNKVDPQLWEVISCATSTVRERYNPMLSIESDTGKNVRKVRRFYILCLLMFCINPSCPSPIHTLLADTVEVCGGSRQLIKILNRLGATTSNDTHDRFVTHKAELQQQKSVLDDLSAEVFTVATVDNFDVLQSHAAVYCGDQHRSYHGTTIQLVQPNPMIEIPNGRKENRNRTEEKQRVEEEKIEEDKRKKGTRKEDKIEERIEEDARRDEDGREEDGRDEDGREEDGRDEDGREEDGRDEDGRDEDGRDEDGRDEDGREEDGGEEGEARKGDNRRKEETGRTEVDRTGWGSNDEESPILCGRILKTCADITSQSLTTDARDQPVCIPNYNYCTKRQCTSSPSRSPHNLGKIGPKRRRTLTVRQQCATTIHRVPVTTHTLKDHTQTEPTLHLADFNESQAECEEKQKLASRTFAYLMEISALQNCPQYSQKTVKPLRDFLTSESQTSICQSNIYYMGLVDENADSDETMMLVTEKVMDELKTKDRNSHLIVVGDGKTYEHLMNIKRHYGSELGKLLVFPGDWHILKNYQEVLMKVYYSCGLKELAKASGFRAETLTSLEKCSNFKRTHLFLMQVWEALYREMLKAFHKTHEETISPMFDTILSEVQQHLQTKTSLSQLQTDIMAKVTDTTVEGQFHKFLDKQSTADDTWRFWKQFVLEDCFAYVCLFSEVHMIFDQPGNQIFNPKDCEQKRRDDRHKQEHHTHIQFTPQTSIPKPWREYLQCRECKHSLVEAIGLSYLQTARCLLHSPQQLVVAGCFSGTAENTAWRITADDLLPQPEPIYRSTAQEADIRLWRHAINSQAHNILIYSPDTDVYNIGLGLIYELSAEYIVQLNPPHCDEQYLHLNKLLRAFENDPDTALLPSHKLGQILQTLFITSGCDYISYINGFGKASVLKCFFQHADFINGSQMPGCLSETQTCNLNSGFQAFLRLIGTLYFKKNLPGFVSEYGFATPNQLFNSIDTASHQHKIWIEKVRTVIADRIVCEEERVPSYGALWRHWLRTCWVSQMWANSPREDVLKGLPPPEHSGWKIVGNHQFEFDWESEAAQQKVQNTIDFLTKGCSCKKRQCHKKSACGCVKNSRYCGPGCECQNCLNLPAIEQLSEDSGEESDNSIELGSSPASEDEDSTGVMDVEIITNIDDIFF